MRSCVLILTVFAVAVLAGCGGNDGPTFGNPGAPRDFAYATNQGDRSISLFEIANARLTPRGTATTQTAIGPAEMAVHPNGRFVYVLGTSQVPVPGGTTCTSALSEVWAYEVQDGGGLRAINNRQLDGRCASGLEIHPGGSYLLVTYDDELTGQRSVATYGVNATTGEFGLFIDAADFNNDDEFGNVEVVNNGLEAVVPVRGVGANTFTRLEVLLLSTNGEMTLGPFRTVSNLVAARGVPGTDRVVALGTSSTISVFRVDANTGDVAETSTVTTVPANAFLLAISRTGSAAAIANGNTVTLYDLNAATPALTVRFTVTFNATAITRLEFSHDGTLVFATDSPNNRLHSIPVNPPVGTGTASDTVTTQRWPSDAVSVRR